MTFLAFHNPEFPPELLLARLAAHREADELIQGMTWENGKGCAVGCSMHAYDHMEYERKGVCTVHLARLEDAIFEGLPDEQSMLWPERFTRALASVKGKDISLVHWKFLLWLLTDVTANPGITNEIVAPAIRQVVDDVILPLSKGENVSQGAARRAAERARSAAWSAALSAESAAWSARSAAWSAALSAESAAWSARSAAWSAALSAESAAWSAAWSALSALNAAESAAWSKQADKLIELIEAV